MSNFNLVGRCGLYCGACGIYRAYKDSKKLQEKIATQFKCKPEDVRCEGCRALTENCWGNDCKIVLCLKAKGFEFCYECGLMDECEKFSKLAQGYQKVGVDLKRNLLMIRKV